MSSRRWSLAWLVLTLGSAITMSLNSARPMLTTGTFTGSRRPLRAPVRTSSDASGAACGVVGVTALLSAGCGRPCRVSASREPAPVGGCAAVTGGMLRRPRDGGGGAASA